jgi:hypothetical protein
MGIASVYHTLTVSQFGRTLDAKEKRALSGEQDQKLNELKQEIKQDVAAVLDKP